MKHYFQSILVSTIKNFELEQILKLGDPCFDAFTFLAEKIGHKNPSTLRKMCLPRNQAAGAKLGFVEAMIIMHETNDYRLSHWAIDELKRLAVEKHLASPDPLSLPSREIERREA